MTSSSEATTDISSALFIIRNLLLEELCNGLLQPQHPGGHACVLYLLLRAGKAMHHCAGGATCAIVRSPHHRIRWLFDHVLFLYLSGRLGPERAVVDDASR